MKTMFGKTLIKCFYQDCFNHYINSKQIIVNQLKTNQHQTSTHILLILSTLFKFHSNLNKSNHKSCTHIMSKKTISIQEIT